MKTLVVLSGAGVSAESGVKTFRDHDGLWENHSIQDVATPEGWQRDPELVTAFYNARRAQLDEVLPNAAHLAIAAAETFVKTVIITQNVDDLHERAGSTHVLHLHGELRKARSSADESYVVQWAGDLSAADRCPKGARLRPHIVWFGEAVPAIEEAAALVATADFVLIVGTSLQVYPAAGLLAVAPPWAQVTYIDPAPAVSYELSERPGAEILAVPASVGVPAYLDRLRSAQRSA